MKQNTVAAVAAVAVVGVAAVKNLKHRREQRAIRAEILLETKKTIDALHTAGALVRKEIAAGRFRNRSIVDVQEAFDFHTIAARIEE